MRWTSAALGILVVAVPVIAVVAIVNTDLAILWDDDPVEGPVVVVVTLVPSATTATLATTIPVIPTVRPLAPMPTVQGD